MNLATATAVKAGHVHYKSNYSPFFVLKEGAETPQPLGIFIGKMDSTKRIGIAIVHKRPYLEAHRILDSCFLHRA